MACNEEHKRVRFGSCKRNAQKHDRTSLGLFRGQVDLFLSTKQGRRFQDWNRELALFAPVFSDIHRKRLEADGWTCRDLQDFRKLLHDDREGKKGYLEGNESLS